MKAIYVGGLALIVAAAVSLRVMERGKKARAAAPSADRLVKPVGPDAQRASKAFAALKTGHAVMKPPKSPTPALHRPFKDPAFDPKQKAFYYLRVLEIPTPRWTLYDAVKYGDKMTPDVPMVQQERAITSAIWYNPA